MDWLYTLCAQADFVEDLLRGRFIEEQFTPAILGAYHWQVCLYFISFEAYHCLEALYG